MKKYILSLILVLISVASFAQANSAIEMANELRGSGKIYLVVGVISIIFLGLAIYLFIIDKKLTRLEKEHQHLEK